MHSRQPMQSHTQLVQRHADEGIMKADRAESFETASDAETPGHWFVTLE